MSFSNLRCDVFHVFLCSFSCAAREKIVGWYHTGPKLNANDLEINELIRKYNPNSVRGSFLAKLYFQKYWSILIIFYLGFVHYRSQSEQKWAANWSLHWRGRNPRRRNSGSPLFRTCSLVDGRRRSWRSWCWASTSVRNVFAFQNFYRNIAQTHKQMRLKSNTYCNSERFFVNYPIDNVKTVFSEGGTCFSVVAEI